MADFSRGESMAQKAKEQLRNDLWCAANNYLDVCSSCGAMHPVDFEDDCRDDKNRFAGIEELVDIWLAAPELLETCKRAYAVILEGNLKQIKGAFVPIKRAIDKAKGYQ